MDVASLGNTTTSGELAGFPWQERKWRVPSTNELYVMRKVLTNLHDIASFGLQPKPSYTVTTYAAYLQGHSEKKVGNSANQEAESLQIARQTWEGMTKYKVLTNFVPYYSNSRCFLGVNIYGDVSVAHIGSNLVSDASVVIEWSDFQNLDFEWPAPMCFSNNIVKNAHVCTLPVAYFEPIKLEAGGSNGLIENFWNKDNTAYIATPDLYITSIRKDAVVHWAYILGIKSARLKEVGRVGTPFNMLFKHPIPSFDSLDWEDRESWYWQKTSSQGSDFCFVILPELNFQYLVD